MSGVGKRAGPKLKVTSRCKTGKGIISEPLLPSARLRRSAGKPEMFIVERILEKKMENGVVQFLIKWEGYPNSSNTWEPIGNIPSDLVREFNENICKEENGTGTVSFESSPTKANECKKVLGLKPAGRSRNCPSPNLKVVQNGLPKTANSEKRILYATDLKNRVIECIQTITLAQPKKEENSRKLVFVVKFEDSAESFAVDSADAYSYFPSQVIKYYESIVNFF